MSQTEATAEQARVDALYAYAILDTPEEQEYDDLAFLATRVCAAPIALVNFIDADRQWIKSKVGLTVTESPRESAFCAHAIQQPDVLVVPDTLADVRFASHPLVTADPHIRFYAGMP